MRVRLIGFAILIASAAWAQVPEDAMRLAAPSLGVGARAVGMGSAFLPVADDYSALFWNPAGLAQLHNHEVSLGLSSAGYSSDASFLGTNQTSSASSMLFDNIGAVFPVRNVPGLTFAIGYNRVSSYQGSRAFSAVNPSSSLIGWTAANTSGDPTQSLLYQTGVAGIVNGVLKTPINGGMLQAGNVLEGGTLRAFSLGAGFQLAEGLDLGLALHIYGGTYTYASQYKETDVNNKYNAQDTTGWTNVDVYQYAQNDNLATDISGVGATLGLLYHVQEAASFGLTVAVPSSYHLSDNFSTTAQALFDNNDLSSKLTQSFHNDYDITTPMTLSGGAAVHPIRLLTISASLDYIDYTQLSFSGTSDQTLIDYNTSMRTLFRPTYNYRLGAEYKFAPLGIGVRAGYQFFESAYAADPSGEGEKTVSGGVSVVLAKRAVLELAYAHGTMNNYHQNYDTTSATNEKVSLNNFLLNFAFRF